MVVLEIDYATKLVVRSIYKDSRGYGRHIQIGYDDRWFHLIIRSNRPENLVIEEVDEE